MSKKIETTRAAITKVTQMLAGSRVNVTQRGDQAFVAWDKRTLKVTRVNIPYLPDNASDDLIAGTQGFLDHEVAHVLFTDAAARVDETLPGAKRIDTLHNMVEDCWIEPKMTQAYKGSAINLANVRRLVFQKRMGTRIDEIIAAKGGLEEPEAVKSMLITLLRALAGHEECVEYMDAGDKWAYFPTILPRIKPYFKSSLDACENSWDTLELAKRVYADIVDKGEADDSSESSDDCDDSGEKSEGTEKSGRKTEGKSEDKKSEKVDDEDEGSDKDDDKDDKGDGSDKDDDKDDDKGDGSEKSASDEGDDSDESEKDDEKSDGDGDEGSDKDKSDTPDADEAEDFEDVTGEDSDEDTGGERSDAEIDALKEALDDSSDFESEASSMMAELYRDAAKTGDSWLVFTNDGDVIEKYEVSPKFRPQLFTDMRDLVTQHIGPMQKDLERMLLAQKRSHYEPGRRSGRLNPSGLHRLRVGDDRVFRKKHESRVKDTAVSLVVDCSGSMGAGPGSRLAVAFEAAYALAVTLERCRIPCTVTGFTTKGMPSKIQEELREAERRAGVRYSVNCEVHYQPIFKEWGERMTSEVSNRFADMRYDNRGIISQNIDPLAVEYAARDILRRPESRKVVIVLSDGWPAFLGDHYAAMRQLKKVVQQTEAAGVEMVGIGIQSEAVEAYYPRNVVINRVSDLGGAVMGELKRILMK